VATGDRILLFPVRPALPSNERVVSGFLNTSTSSPTSGGDDADRMQRLFLVSCLFIICVMMRLN
jgi:hypothetical protein